MPVPLPSTHSDLCLQNVTVPKGTVHHTGITQGLMTVGIPRVSKVTSLPKLSV